MGSDLGAEATKPQGQRCASLCPGHRLPRSQYSTDLGEDFLDIARAGPVSVNHDPFGLRCRVPALGCAMLLSMSLAEIHTRFF